jgi:uncharacterized protein (TIGR03437 family)
MWLRAWLALGTAFAGAAWAQAPSYSAAGIVNASNYAPGPFAPNSVLSLFGSNLAYSTQTLTSDLIAGGKLPILMAGVGVYVDGSLAPLLYVSPVQINFLVPITEIAGNAQVTVVRQGVAGPTVTLNLASAAPQLFSDPNNPGYVLAEDWNLGNAVIAPGARAQGGDILILFATGLGAVVPMTASGELAEYASPIANPGTLTVTIGGTALNPSAILYAGLTPGSAGLYQINLVLPANSAANPVVQVSVGGQASAAGCQLAVQ